MAPGTGGSGWEIERRWLVRVREGLREELGEGWSLRQGYLKADGVSVRIRTGEPRGPVLTCKSGRGVKRREADTVVPGEVAEMLFTAAGKRVLEKTRYPVGPWELDYFDGDLEGLVLLELEMEDPDDPVPEPPEGIEVVHEVTDDRRMTSGNLASLSGKEQRKLVRRIYEEFEG